MIKTLHKAIIREIVLIFFITVLCLNFVLMMEKVYRLSRFMSSVGTSFLDFVKILLLVQPQMLVLTIPMSFLLAVLISYGRMNMDSEIIVMRSVGMSLNQISLPSALTGLVVIVITFAMTFMISPLSGKKLRALINDTIRTRAPLALEEGVFQTTPGGMTVMIGEKPALEEMRNIFLYDPSNPERPLLITAESGTILLDNDKSPFFDIRNGYVHIIRDDMITELHFERYLMEFDPGLNLFGEKVEEKYPWELLKEYPIAEGKDRKKIILEFHRRLTLPLINIFIIFLGPALAMRSGKHGRLSGFLYGVGVFGAYYSILIYFENIIKAGTIPPAFAWAPLFLIGSFSLAIYGWEARK